MRGDVCVIGAGPAGAVLASALAEAGRRVVVLERGPALGGLSDRRSRVRRELIELEPASYLETIPPEHGIPYEVGGDGAYRYPRINAVGGTSLSWQGYCPRPTEADLGEVVDGRRWPITYRELEPWLLEAERELGVAADDDNRYASPRSGPFPMPRHAPTTFERERLRPATARLGWGVHGQPVAVASRPYRGRPACQRWNHCEMCPSGARYSADLVHVMRARARGAELLSSMQLLRLELGADGRRVRAAHAIRRTDHEEVIVVAQTFVIAAGGVESARILALSADPRHPDGLGNGGGWLGRGFTDHALLRSQLTLRTEAGPGGWPQAAGCDHFRRSAEEHRGFAFLAVPGYLARTVAVGAFEEGALDARHLRERVRRSVLVATTIALDAGGRIELSPTERDEHGLPEARVTLELSARDRATAEAAMRALDRLGEAIDATSVDHPYRAGGALAWGAHPMGACAMAATEDAGVVDADLRVFGVENLYVASSAVFPHLGAANPTLTIVALSLRLAAHLARPRG